MSDPIAFHLPATPLTLTSLADYTTPGLLIPRLDSRTASGAIAELCARLEFEGRIHDALAFYDAVLSRETLCSTAAAPGWALPHARVRGLSQLSVALGLRAEPITWYSGEAVQMVFLFAVPDDQAANHLRLISALARLSREPLQLERLLRSKDGESMLQVLQEIPLRQSRAAALQI